MYDRQPHGQLGKAYAAAALIGGAVIMTAVLFAPFWLIAIVTVVLVLAALGFVAWLTQARGGEG